MWVQIISANIDHPLNSFLRSKLVFSSPFVRWVLSPNNSSFFLTSLGKITTTMASDGVLSFAGRAIKMDKGDDGKLSCPSQCSEDWSLCQLLLSSCIFNAVVASEIVSAINDCKNLRTLILEGNTMGVQAAELIGKALGKHPEFEVGYLLSSFKISIRFNSRNRGFQVVICNYHNNCSGKQTGIIPTCFFR